MAGRERRPPAGQCHENPAHSPHGYRPRIRADADIERSQLRFTAYMLVWRSLVAGGAALPVMSTPFLCEVYLCIG